jgi:hypothetical protein
MNATLKTSELIFLSDTQCDSTILLRKKLQNYILSSSWYKDLPASIKDTSFLNYGKTYLMSVVLKVYICIEEILTGWKMLKVHYFNLKQEGNKMLWRPRSK